MIFVDCDAFHDALKFEEGFQTKNLTCYENIFQVRNKYTRKVYVVAESRLSALPVEKPKSAASNGPSGDSKKSKSGKTENPMDSYDFLEKVKGKELAGKK